MENRLPWQQQLLLLLMIVGCTLSFSTFLQAQSFTLNYTGPDTLFVGNNCTTTLDWGHPNTVTFTAENSNEIDTFYISSISAGLQIGDTIRSIQDTAIIVAYYVVDTAGVDSTITLSLIIGDSIPPIFEITTLPRDTIYSSLDSVPSPPDINGIIATDNCGVETIRYNGESSPRPLCGQFTRTWEAIDSAGNTTVYTQIITINADENAPVWSTNPTNIDYACNTGTSIDDWLAANGNGTITDTSNFTVTHDFLGIDSCFIENRVVTLSLIHI